MTSGVPARDGTPARSEIVTTRNLVCFLRLPTELRLNIYRYCSAFALLQLSHTSSVLYGEINACVELIRTSYGYLTERQPDNGGPIDCGSVNPYTGEPFMHSIRFVHFLRDESEVLLWNRLFFNGQRLWVTSEAVKSSPVSRHPCERCYCIFSMEDFHAIQPDEDWVKELPFEGCLWCMFT
ncbi:hypothetical protein BJ508DRAFT_148871 [Ascobolus immersus RN42]|uniref:F-box domain-containing protein n=1 Tax=Ascobolus immersus RN42 TaxID=1160509 RepID=A0A3N4IJH7_ASCIM|nr:hypothetical protein BJ508DRAFT_148871 [Ascobolus immersus RN42]